jgi:hypothetical protein
MASDGRTQDGAATGPMLMLGFGLLALVFGIYEWVRAVEQATPLVVACETEAIEAAGKDRWIVAKSCWTDWAHPEERKIGKQKKQFVPILDEQDGTPVAVLVADSRRKGDVSETIDVEGEVGRMVDGLPSIERGRKPSRDTAIFSVVAGVVLLGLGAFYSRGLFAAEPPVEVRPPSVDRSYTTAASYEQPRIASLAPRPKGATFLDRGDDFNFVLLLGIPPLLGIAAAIGHFTAAFSVPFDPWIVALLVVPFGLMLVWGLLQQRGQDRFPARVRAATTFTGSVIDAGERITADSEIAVFGHVVSMVAVSITFASRPLVVGIDRIWPTQVIATTMTLLFGWWAFPSGPFKTLAALRCNLRGGHRERVGDLEGPLDQAHAPHADA